MRVLLLLLAAAAAGALPALGHWPSTPWWLQWAAFVPLLWVTQRRGPLAAFGLGWLAGVSWYAVGGFWIAATIRRFANLPLPLEGLAFLVLCAYHGLQLALMAGVARWVGHYLEKRGVGPQASLLLAAAPALACVEGYFPNLMPIYAAGTQVPHLPAVQIIDTLGLAGVSWLLALSNVGLYAALRSLADRRREPAAPVRWRLLALAAVLALANEAYGHARMRQLDAKAAALVAQGKTLRVAVAQASIPVMGTFDDAALKCALEAYTLFTRQAMAKGARLVVWPQNAYERWVVFRREGGALLEPMGETGTLEQVWKTENLPPVHILMGAPAMALTLREGRSTVVRDHYVAILRSPDGKFLGVAAKRHPVPFTEYIPVWPSCPPLQAALSRMRRLWAGPQPPLDTQDGRRLGVYICYDAADPVSARDLVLRGAELLVDQGSDAMSPDQRVEPVQHLRHSVLRAVENRKFLARAMTNGISCFVDPAGRVRSRLGMDERGVIVEDLPLMPGATPQARWGRALYHLGLLLLLGGALYGLDPALRRLLEGSA